MPRRFRLLEPASFAALKGDKLRVACSKSLMRLNRGLADAQLSPAADLFILRMRSSRAHSRCTG